MALESTKEKSDGGFTLIELLIVIMIVGVLATIVVFSVRGVTDDAQSVACDADARALATSVEGYFALAPATMIPDNGGPGGHEAALVSLGLLREPSALYDVNDEGELVSTSAACTA